MMTHSIDFSRILGRRALPGLFLALFAALGWAGGGGATVPGGGTNGSLNTSSPGDEIGTLPFSDDPSGLTLVGRLAEIRGLVLSIQGEGAIHLQRLADGRVSATLMGAYRLELDRARLARTDVQILFRGGALFQGGAAQLSILGSAPFRLPAERIQLPFARLAGSGVLGVGLELDVLGLHADQLHGAALLERDRVTWVQRAR